MLYLFSVRQREVSALKYRQHVYQYWCDLECQEKQDPNELCGSLRENYFNRSP